MIPLLLIGGAIGFLVGLTGMGGGALLLPALVYLLHRDPMVAVGTSLVASFMTKSAASFIHWKHKNVDKLLLWRLLLGSVPGSFIGATALEALKIHHGKAADKLVMSLTAFLLILLPLLTLLRYFVGKVWESRFHHWGRIKEHHPLSLGLLGLIAGVLVGLTSVGSGTVVITFLMFFLYREGRVLIGTDVVHATFITGFAGLVHVFFGNINGQDTVFLLISMLPGVWGGILLVEILPSRIIKGTITLLLLIIGFWMLFHV